jgi:hypothetical protein
MHDFSVDTEIWKGLSTVWSSFCIIRTFSIYLVPNLSYRFVLCTEEHKQCDQLRINLVGPHAVMTDILHLNSCFVSSFSPLKFTSGGANVCLKEMTF